MKCRPGNPLDVVYLSCLLKHLFSSCGGPTSDGRRTWTFDEAEKCGFSITSDGTSITFEFDFTAVKKVCTRNFRNLKNNIQTKTEVSLETLFSGTCVYAQEVVLDQSLSTDFDAILPSTDFAEVWYINISH